MSLRSDVKLVFMSIILSLYINGQVKVSKGKDIIYRIGQEN